MAAAVATNVATLNAYVIDQRCYMFTYNSEGEVTSIPLKQREEQRQAFS